MATTNGSNFWSDTSAGFRDLILDYGKTKLIDVENENSDNNIPDTNDLVNATPAVESNNMMGGAYSALGGVNPAVWIAVLFAGILGVVIIKKAL